MTWVVFGHALFIPLTTRTVSNSLEVGSKWPLNFMTQVKILEKIFSWLLFRQSLMERFLWIHFSSFLVPYYLTFSWNETVLGKTFRIELNFFWSAFKSANSKILNLIFHPFIMLKSKKMMFVCRFIRLTPLPLMISFFYATILPKIGNGPLWQFLSGRFSHNCEKWWWHNLLYIQNIPEANPKGEICMGETWYLG